jgi:hypothetical protein
MLFGLHELYNVEWDNNYKSLLIQKAAEGSIRNIFQGNISQIYLEGECETTKEETQDK